MSLDYRRDDAHISTDTTLLDMDMIHGFLSQTYWAEDIPRAIVEKAMAHSLCYGVYMDDQQVGFARLITDMATYAYLSDVFILPAYQGQGLGDWLIACIRAHPELQGLRKWSLATRDAHTLYARHGFTPLSNPDANMEILRMGLYKKQQGND